MICLAYTLNIFWRESEKTCFANDTYAIPFNYSDSAGLESLNTMVADGASNIQNVTNTFSAIIIYGLINHLLLSIIVIAKNKKDDQVGTWCVRLLLLSIIIQTAAMIAIRLSHTGKVCSGDLDNDGFDIYAAESYYLGSEGQFMMVQSIIMIIIVSFILIALFAKNNFNVKAFDQILSIFEFPDKDDEITQNHQNMAEDSNSTNNSEDIENQPEVKPKKAKKNKKDKKHKK